MKVLGPDPGRVFVPSRQDPTSVARGKSPNAFRALAGGRTPLSPMQARTHLNVAWLAVTGRPAPAEASALLQAQWALETNAGSAMYGNNFAGVKARSGGAAFRTREGQGENAVTIVDRFRTYRTPEAGAADYVELLARRYPDALEAADRGDLRGFATALADGGYYTASEISYARGLEHWRAHFRDGAPPPASDVCTELAKEGVLRALAK